MKNNASHKLLLTTIAIVVLTLLSGIVINALTSNDDFSNWLKANEIGAKHLIAGMVIIGLALIALAYLQFRYAEKSEDEKQTLAEDIEPDVKKLHNSLKERYQNRYESKLDERFEITLEVSEDWDGRKTQTFYERYDKDAKISGAFPRLKELFNTKDGLLIVGEPGVGKTVLLLKIALNLLEKNNLAKKETFPVIFNLASWSEDYKDFGEWLKAMLISGNGLSKDFAARLLYEKRLILLLDGLDELARNEDETAADKKRAACLEALNNYLDGEKTIICCRIDEFNAMLENTAQDAPVSAKVEVLNLTEAEVLNALEHAQNQANTQHHASAKNLSELVAKEENAALRKIICTPFYFTIALEIFYKHLPDEINMPKTEEKLKTFLIEKYVERKLQKTPNPNNFDKEKTKKWLEWLAQLMEMKQRITFELADLQPNYLKKKWHYNLVIGLVGGLFFGLYVGFVGGIFFGLHVGLIVGLLGGAINGLVVGLIGGLVNGLVGDLFGGLRNDTFSTEDLINLNFSRLLSWDYLKGVLYRLVVGLVVGLSVGLVGGLFFGLNVGLVGGVFVGLIVGLFVGLFGGSFGGLFHENIATEDLINLNFSKLLTKNYWKGIFYRLVAGMFGGWFFGLVVGLFFGLYFGLFGGLFGGLFFGLFGSLFFGLENLKEIKGVTIINNPYQRIYGGFFVNFFLACSVFVFLTIWFFPMSYVETDNVTNPLKAFLVLILLLPFIQLIRMPLFRHFALRLALFCEGLIPSKYATFLDYAAAARILEKDCGFWPFRHQNLQKYFADLEI